MNTRAGHAKKPVRIILDSNALFVPIQFKIDILEELSRILNARIELVLLSPVKWELEKLAKEASPKTQKYASYALKLAERCTVFQVDDHKSATDDIITRVASEWKAPVFTNDRQLRRKLRNISVPVIYVRQKSRLEIDGRI